MYIKIEKIINALGELGHTKVNIAKFLHFKNNKISIRYWENFLCNKMYYPCNAKKESYSVKLLRTRQKFFYDCIEDYLKGVIKEKKEILRSIKW